jgi:uncharacterized protein (TIGR03437 family)
MFRLDGEQDVSLRAPCWCIRCLVSSAGCTDFSTDLDLAKHPRAGSSEGAAKNRYRSSRGGLRCGGSRLVRLAATGQIGRRCIPRSISCFEARYCGQVGLHDRDRGAFESQLTLDAAGSLYVYGTADVNAFAATPGAYRGSPSILNGNDFVCKLRSADGEVLFCALLDTDGAESGGFAVDSSGNIYFAEAPLNRYADPTPGALMLGKGNIYVTKLDPAGSRVLYRAEFGGSEPDRPSGIAVDAEGNVRIAGTAYSEDFPVSLNALVGTFPQSADPFVNSLPYAGFLAKLNSSGTTLLYSTYTVRGEIPDILLDRSGNIYTYGSNSSPTAELQGAVRKYNPAGTSVLYVCSLPRLLGGPIAVDELGIVTLVGRTSDVRFPLHNPVQSCNLARFGEDGALIRIGPTGELLESTFLAGTGSPAFTALSVQAANGQVLSASTQANGVTIRLEMLQLGPPLGVPRERGNAELKLACLGNAASSALGSTWSLTGVPLAPGEIVSLNGKALGPSTPAHAPLAGDSRLPFELDGTQVTFDSAPAPLLYASDGQIDAITPWSVAGKPATQVCVVFRGARTNCIMAGVTAAAPAIFQSAPNQAAAVNQDGTINSPQNPAPAGSVVSLFATGLGPVTPAPLDGSIVGFPLPAQAYPVEAMFLVPHSVAPLAAQVLYAGPAPLQVAGVSQVNIVIPRSGLLAVSIQVDLPGGIKAGSPYLSIAIAP